MITTSTWLQQWSLSREQFKRSQWTGITSFKTSYPLVLLKEKSDLICSRLAQSVLDTDSEKDRLLQLFPPDISN